MTGKITPTLERLSRTVIYRSQWVNLYRDRVRFPNGRVIEEHHLIDIEQPSVIVLVENEGRDILFVRVTRYTTGQSHWELPAGRVEPGEDPLESARREVLEETGWTINGVEQVHVYYSLAGLSNHRFLIVRGRGEQLVTEFDGQEVDEIRWFSPREVETMLRNGEILGGPTLTAVLYSWYLDDRRERE